MSWDDYYYSVNDFLRDNWGPPPANANSDAKITQKLSTIPIVTTVGRGTNAAPAEFVNAIIALEDRDFYNSDGVNLSRMVAAIVRGGAVSTIPVQLAKIFTGNAKTVENKAQQAQIAWRINEIYPDKDRIMEFYINNTYFGNVGGEQGAQAAARSIFGKDASQMNPAESVIMAAALQVPGRMTRLLANPIEVRELLQHPSLVSPKVRALLNQSDEKQVEWSKSPKKGWTAEEIETFKLLKNFELIENRAQYALKVMIDPDNYSYWKQPIKYSDYESARKNVRATLIGAVLRAAAEKEKPLVEIKPPSDRPEALEALPPEANNLTDSVADPALPLDDDLLVSYTLKQDGTLSQGDEAVAVLRPLIRQLQQSVLRSAPLLGIATDGITIDGIYSPALASVIATIQQRMGLEANGKLDKNTAVALQILEAQALVQNLDGSGNIPGDAKRRVRKELIDFNGRLPEQPSETLAQQIALLSEALRRAGMSREADTLGNVIEEAPEVRPTPRDDSREPTDIRPAPMDDPDTIEPPPPTPPQEEKKKDDRGFFDGLFDW